MDEPDPANPLEEAIMAAERAGRLARVALIIACMAIALAILGMFLPIEIGPAA